MERIKATPDNPSPQSIEGANSRQVAGNHYSAPIQHWDFAASNNFDYFQGQITKYVSRWKKKGGRTDLLKARHFLDKYLEITDRERLQSGAEPTSRGYVSQDPDDRPGLLPLEPAPQPDAPRPNPPEAVNQEGPPVDVNSIMNSLAAQRNAAMDEVARQAGIVDAMARSIKSLEDRVAVYEARELVRKTDP